MAAELELYVSSSKYEARITMLEGYVSDLQALVLEYESLKNSVTDFIDGDQVEIMKTDVDRNIKRINTAIEAAQASIAAVRHTMTTMDNAGQNLTTLIQDSIEIANTLFL